MAERELRKCSLFTASARGQTLDQAIGVFIGVAENKPYLESKEQGRRTLAIFYAPHRCYLARWEEGTFKVSSGKEISPLTIAQEDLRKVFEARIFNDLAELRWLNDPNGYHSTAILSETPLIFNGKPSESEPKVVGALSQKYLLWGQSTGKPSGDWTEFGTARIGAFHVPLSNVPAQDYARFTAFEYLRTYEDGNVNVVDERLTGIEGYEGEPRNG